MSGETTHVRLFVRSLSPSGARDRPSNVVDRLEELVDNGHISEYSVHVWGREVGLSTSAAASDRVVLERVAELRSWADDRGISLEGFHHREVTTVRGETHTVLTLPMLALAVYTDGELTGVAPCSNGVGTRTVDDSLEEMASGPERTERQRLTS